MLAHLEVRVWEADEDLGELMTGEEVGEEFHGVAAKRGDILVVAGDKCCGEAIGGGLVWVWL